MALPETFTHQDELLTISSNAQPFLDGLLHPGISVAPMFLDTHNGVWCLRVKFKPGVTLPLHYHTGVVHFYTMSGCWYYTEYPDQKQTAGSYLFEPGGSIHQLNVPADNTEDTDTFMIVFGANVNFTETGEYINMMDAGLIKTWVDQAIKEQPGAEDVRYISSPAPSYTKS
ncbi:2,4'-dihydroxyacetophenone dioxygenase family protein [Pseudomonas sp. RL_15y_Pfl2_60]|uniref:2,4'-dihydroxyacetophenone dioxygenase family protein n=1 Tax=Pseudomonas sp. RL_15y_Pfl2_60 TaxID=3088709 RepID=UPI0030D77BCC